MGNLASVQKALARSGMGSRLVSTAAEIEAARRLILPGVGAFGAIEQGISRSFCEIPA